MFKKTITYNDYDGNQRTEDFFFNLTKSELTIMSLKREGGLANYIDRIINSQDGEKIIETLEEIVAKSYGVKSLDGKRFMKSPELYKEFKETEAFNEFFYELLTDSNAAAAFINGVASSLNNMNEIPMDKAREILSNRIETETAEISTEANNE